MISFFKIFFLTTIFFPLEKYRVVSKKSLVGRQALSQICERGSEEGCLHHGLEMGRYERTLVKDAELRNPEELAAFVFRQIPQHERSLGFIGPKDEPLVCLDRRCEVTPSFLGDVSLVVREKEEIRNFERFFASMSTG